ncbi:MAG: hypothetical protein HFH72_09380 [Lachnospiraceae bacterium]|nr:hypothetical protein [Lachnospiraceae bacterium]
MSKSILVIDTPDSCIDCPCNFAGMSGQVWCGKENKELLADDIQTFKPDWCPLKDVPTKKKENKYHNSYQKGQADGWNMCIDEILKGDGAE